MEAPTLTLQERARAAHQAARAAEAERTAAERRRVAERRADALEEKLYQLLGVAVSLPAAYDAPDPTDGPRVTVEGLTFVLDGYWDLHLETNCPRCGTRSYCP